MAKKSKTLFSGMGGEDWARLASILTVASLTATIISKIKGSPEE